MPEGISNEENKRYYEMFKTMMNSNGGQQGHQFPFPQNDGGFQFPFQTPDTSGRVDKYKEAQQDKIDLNRKRVEDNVNQSVNKLDQNYFLKALNQNQQQVDNGINAGMAADQDFRMALGRQNAMGDIYSQANQQKMQMDNAEKNLDAEAMQYEDQLRNSNFNNSMNYWKMSEDIRRNNRNFDRDSTLQDREYHMQQGQLTGNYVSTEARPFIQQILEAKQVAQNPNVSEEIRQQALGQAEQMRTMLASMGVDVSRLGADTSYDSSIESMDSITPTMDQQKLDWTKGLQEAEMTGTFENPDADGLIQQLLELKLNFQDDKGSRAMARKADDLVTQLQGMGVDNANQLFGPNVSYKEALNNVGNISEQTLPSRQFDQKLDEQKRQYNNNLLEERRQFDQNLDWNQSEFWNTLDWEQRKHSSNQQLERERMELDRDLADMDYSLGELQIDLENAKLLAAQAQNTGQYSEQQANANTQAVIGSLSGLEPKEVIEQIKKYSKAWANRGVDIDQVIRSAKSLQDILGSDSDSQFNFSDDMGSFLQTGRVGNIG